MSMDIVEEVERRRQTIHVEDPERAYSELRDLLERRMAFDEVKEEKYFNDIDEGRIRSKIVTVEEFDAHTVEEIEVFLYISKDSREMGFQAKAKLVTSYPTDGWKGSLWYYAYRALYDKFLYGHIRHNYEHSVEEKVEELFERVRQSVEAKPGG